MSSSSVSPNDTTTAQSHYQNNAANSNSPVTTCTQEAPTVSTNPTNIIAPINPDEDDERTYRLLLSKLQNDNDDNSNNAIPFLHLGPHPPSTTSQESADIRVGLGWKNVTIASGAKAMLIKNGRRKNNNSKQQQQQESSENECALDYVLAVMAANEKLDWKKMKKLLGPKSRSKGARMASVEEMWEVTGCKPGGVPPFGSLFELPLGKDDDGGGGGSRGTVRTFVDRSLQRQGDVINFNCGLRTRSIQMSFVDYFELEKPDMCDFVVEDAAPSSSDPKL